jgi:iron complex outermembrane receptor protein
VRTQGNLGYAPVDLSGTVNYYGLYGVDAVNLTEALTLTLGFRVNIANIDTQDNTGLAPELTATHGFTHFNPMAGATYAVTNAVSVYAGYSQANRAPPCWSWIALARHSPAFSKGRWWPIRS